MGRGRKRPKRWRATVRRKEYVIAFRIAAALQELGMYERKRILRAASLLVGDGQVEEALRPR